MARFYHGDTEARRKAKVDSGGSGNENLPDRRDPQ